MARNKAVELRKKHKEEQNKVKEKAKEQLLLNERLAEEKERARLEKKQEMIKAVKDHGGPCLCSEDLQKLLAQINMMKVAEKKGVLQSEIKYQKYLVGKLLRVSC